MLHCISLEEAEVTSVFWYFAFTLIQVCVCVCVYLLQHLKVAAALIKNLLGILLEAGVISLDSQANFLLKNLPRSCLCVLTHCVCDLMALSCFLACPLQLCPALQ